MTASRMFRRAAITHCGIAPIQHARIAPPPPPRAPSPPPPPPPVLLPGFTVRAAALWAATNAPLSVAPDSLDSLAGALEQERTRSAELVSQLTDLQRSGAALQAALRAAQARLGEDQATAEGLRDDLAAAEAKLKKVEDALRAAAARQPTVVTSGGGTRATREDRNEDHDEEDAAIA